MFIAGFLREVPHLELPLTPVGWIDGDAGYGMSAPQWLPFEDGLIISRKGLMSGHSFDLSTELWSQRVDEWPDLVDDQDRVCIGVQQGKVMGFDKRSGKTIHAIPIPVDGFLYAVSESGPIVSHRSKDLSIFEAFDWSGKSLWRHGSFGSIIPTPGICLIRENLGESLAALAESSGNLLWRFSASKTGDRGPRDISNEISSGLPSVVVLGDRVIVIVVDGRVFSLDRRTGEVLSQGRTPVNGSFQVTATSIFFAQPFCFSEFDHRLMCEVNRLEYREHVEPLYGKQPRTLNAFCFSEESIIWTTGHGALLGISRKDSSLGKRATWMDQKNDVLMPMATPPLILGGYLYYRRMGTSTAPACGLLCYRGSSSNQTERAPLSSLPRSADK
jgi:hypothetical protein